MDGLQIALWRARYTFVADENPSDHPVKFPKWLSHRMCDVLVDHIDSAIPIDLRNYDYRQSVAACLRHDLLKNSWGNGRKAEGPPRATVLTEKGRDMLGKVLGHWADKLTRAMELTPAPNEPSVNRSSLLPTGAEQSASFLFPSRA